MSQKPIEDHDHDHHDIQNTEIMWQKLQACCYSNNLLIYYLYEVFSFIVLENRAVFTEFFTILGPSHLCQNA